MTARTLIARSPSSAGAYGSPRAGAAGPPPGAGGRVTTESIGRYGLIGCRAQVRPPSRVVQMASALNEARAVFASCQPSVGTKSFARVGGAAGCSVVFQVAPPSFETTTP